MNLKHSDKLLSTKQIVQAVKETDLIASLQMKPQRAI